ncbi:MAG: peptide chain release factor 2 [Firmicutes bacterium]|nr:peptide chain release factor 2 [Bacillota bacterium]
MKWGSPFEAEAKLKEIAELEARMAEAGFWDDQQEAQAVIARLNSLRKTAETWSRLRREWQELMELTEIALLEDEQDMAPEIGRNLESLRAQLAELELTQLLNGKYDRNNAIITLHSGAGGLEAQDWAEMLLRMYTRWAERKGFAVEVLDYLPDEEAGIKSATLLVKGEYAFGYLKAEKGVHRLVRISPFDSSGRRHTSFASLDVIPEVPEDVEVEIKAEDLRIDTFRSSGAGGQHVNTTDSAVRITHLPTGIVVTCQNERSQHANRLAAMKILRARLADLQRREQEEELARIRGEQREIGWGSQIRSYVFHPYSLVKDHRTNVEVGNAGAVIDGDLDVFIDSWLRWQAGIREG